MRPILLSVTVLASMLLTPRSLPAQATFSRAEYIEKYKALAVKDMVTYNIPASITMAQAILESSDGNSPLAREANNHFGIKCKRDWTGGTFYKDDDEPNECFRKYANAEASFRDHAEFLESSPRYKDLFKLDTRDYTGWARGLKEAGYATNPLYAQMLVKIIEDNKLYLLDEQKSPSEIKREAAAAPQYASDAKPDLDNYNISVRSLGGHSVYANNGSEFIVAAADDTYETIGHLLGISASRLRRYNDHRAENQPSPGSMVYIRNKSTRNYYNKLIHVAEQGESLWSISQRYGIRLKNLARLNRTSSTVAVSVGQQIRLM